MPNGPRHGRIEGAIVMIGFGSIGRGTLPLIERHFDYDKRHFVVIDPDDSDRKLLDERGIKFIHMAITRDNYYRRKDGSKAWFHVTASVIMRDAAGTVSDRAHVDSVAFGGEVFANPRLATELRQGHN